MEFTHLDKDGNVKMVDVGHKDVTKRTAKARAVVNVNVQTMELIKSGEIKKGNVLACARVAGIMASKKTWDIIPMCHMINITGVEMDFSLSDTQVVVTSTVSAMGETGAEMEALTAVGVASLTIYDMCKSVQRDITISCVELLYKSGGKSGEYIKER